MIIMGAGICQWFHGDATYRAILALLILNGSWGATAGAGRTYVGQEKSRPITGWPCAGQRTGLIAPPRTMIGTRTGTCTRPRGCDSYSADALKSPLARGHGRHHTADAIASARLRWMLLYPQFDRNPLDLLRRRKPPRRTLTSTPVVDALKNGTLNPAVEDVDAPQATGREHSCCGVQPVRLIGQGQQYFLKNLLATTPMSSPRSTPRPQTAERREMARQAPEGKLDLLVSADFRMTSTTLLSDVVFPAAPGTRRTTSRRRTCIRSCTHSRRRSTRRGRRRATSTPSTCSRAGALRARPHTPRRAQGPGERADDA